MPTPTVKTATPTATPTPKVTATAAPVSKPVTPIKTTTNPPIGSTKPQQRYY